VGEAHPTIRVSTGAYPYGNGKPQMITVEHIDVKKHERYNA
jgi:hypothetical protein